MNWFLLQQQNNYDDFQNNSNQFLELHEVDSRNDMENFGNVMVPSEMKHFLSWNAEEGIRVKENECADDISWVKNMESSDSRNNFKKRKAESILAEKTTEKCIKRDAEEESKVTENNSRGASEDTSKGNSKLPEVKKPDYIHVRARRGQATDSHSLAERARREKISKKMKCLQDLVPGCDKAMGKAGMLDEIINYFQSLQRQVEFLSMKLAALNPQIDFKCDDFLAKELPACLANFQGITSSPPITSLDINQLNPGQQGSLNISSLTNSSQEASQQILRSSVPFPELYLDPTCISQVHQFPVCDADFMRLFRMGFH